MPITDNFTFEELCTSQTAINHGISNVPSSAEIIINLARLCFFVLQPLREHFNEPVHISSGYRCPALNSLVGGVSNSQHMIGQAADIYLGGDTKKELAYYNYIRKNLDFDQLILEGNQHTTWIHVSYNSKKLNRKKSWTSFQKTGGA